MGGVCQGVHRYLECLLAGRRPSQRLIFWKSGQICKCPIGLINKTCGFKSLSSIQMKDGTSPLLPPPPTEPSGPLASFIRPHQRDHLPKLFYLFNSLKWEIGKETFLFFFLAQNENSSSQKWSKKK